MNQTRSLYLIRGCPSAGKSTLCKTLADEHSEILAADDYFYQQGTYKFDPSKLKEAHEECQEACDANMKGGTEKIFINNTFIKRWEMEPYFKMAEKYGYMVYVMVVEKYHNNKNDHNVPEEKVLEMEKNLRENLKFI